MTYTKAPEHPAAFTRLIDEKNASIEGRRLALDPARLGFAGIRVYPKEGETDGVFSGSRGGVACAEGSDSWIFERWHCANPYSTKRSVRFANVADPRVRRFLPRVRRFLPRVHFPAFGLFFLFFFFL